MYKTKICPICGNAFVPKSSRQRYCNAPVTRICSFCGKEYQSECSATYSKCCSKECTVKYAHQQSVNSYNNIKRVCILCGKEFTPRNNTQQICDDRHFRTCIICGKQFEVIWKRGRNIDEIAKTCSPECKTKASFINGNPFSIPEKRDKAKQTMLSRYGVEHPMHSAEIRAKVDATSEQRYGAKRFTQTSEYIEKAKATNQQRYGADWAMQTGAVQQKVKDTLMTNYGVANPMESEELKEKISVTYKERTGYDHPMHNPTVVDQVKATTLEHYGVEYALQNKDIQAKAADTMQQRYGVSSPLQSEEFKAKARETSHNRYGYDNPAKSPKIQAKIADTMLKHHGVSHYNESWDYRKSVMTNPERVEDWKSFLSDPEQYVSMHFDHKPNYKELSEVLGVNDSSIQVHLARMGKTELVQYTLSYVEDEVIDILKGINPTMQIVRHNREIIKPYEIDIYLPEYRIGIEVNPTSTHNSSFGAYGRDVPTAPSYHRMKSDMCRQQGVFLFHIFGYEWSHKRAVIISMLRNLIGNNVNKIYARKCELKEVPGKEAYDFLRNNHRQGAVHSKVRYGLYYQGELVSLMTFGKMRNTLGTGHQNLTDCWELVRFCNKLDTSVVGGASRLFTRFVKEYTPERVRSFSDCAHTRGGLYATLGFKEVARNSESYVWVDVLTNKAYSRVVAQKHNIQSFFKDPTIDLSKTERGIMESHGYARVYDSGTITWEWNS